MAEKGRVKVGIIGSRFEADIHAESFKIMPDEAEVVAVASPTPGNAAALARTLSGDSHNSLGRDMLGVVLKEPIGVAAILCPWNFPFLIVSRKLPVRRAPGRPAVGKPVGNAPLATPPPCRPLPE